MNINGNVNIILNRLDDVQFVDAPNPVVELLDPWRKRKEIYLLKTDNMNFVVKFFKRNISELFSNETWFRSHYQPKHSPELIYHESHLVYTDKNHVMKPWDYMFFVEQFIWGKTLGEILAESKDIYSDISYIQSAYNLYMQIFDITYANNFILKNANPKNVIFQNSDINKPYNVDRTAMKCVAWYSKKDAKREYIDMLNSNIQGLYLKYVK